MRISIVDWTHQFLKQYIKEGNLVVDATMGNGGDTLFLAELVNASGRVIAFDVQQMALDHTREKLEKHNLAANASLHLDSHANLLSYVDAESVQAVVFNLGYLPGGDHSKATQAESTIQAIKASLVALKQGGVISLCIYSGGDSGFEEKDAVLTYLKELDGRKYLVIKNEFYNKPNNPPIPVFIIKL